MYKNQSGMTLIGWVLTLVVIGFALLITMRLVPIYMEGYQVSKILGDMENEGRLAGESRRELRKTFEKRLNINQVDTVSDDDLEFKDVSGGTQIVLEYEARTTLVGNLDAVASFRKEVLIRN